MKKLSISKGLILLLFTAFISVNLWGQTPEPKDKINLATCTVTVNGGSPYGYTGSNISVTDAQVVVKTNTDVTVPQEDYEISRPATINEKGQYTLTVTAKEGSENYTGSKNRKFYVLAKTDDDYTISSVEDWDLFASCVEDGYNFNGLTVKLTANIGTNEYPVTTMVGYVVGYGYTPFSGTFNGNGKTLNVSYSEDYYNAPFYYTDGATIKNLTVTGSIVTTSGGDYQGYSAGLIYSNDKIYVDRNTTIQNVTVSVNITNGSSGSAGDYCGGFSAYSSYMEFEDCVYNGKIIAGDNSGGFCGEYVTTGGSTFTNCIFNPHADSNITGGENFGTGTVNDANCYYTMQVGSSEQGTLAYKTVQENIITKKVTVNNTNVYKPVTVTTTAEETYLYNSENNHYDDIIGCTVYFDNYEATSSDYDISITKGNGDPVNGEVINAGEYKLIITTKAKVERVYYGSVTKTFYVVSELTGEGTSENPFKIRSSADWLMFANHVNNGDTYTDAAKTEHPYSEAYYRLTNDITTSEMVGTSEHPFSGIFTGQAGEHAANTLTFNYGTSENPTTEEIVAPFRYTDGATIISLIVDGAIYTNVGKESGLIGVNTNSTTVRFVINKVNFICYEDLFDAEGGGYAYDGSGISFIYSSYEGTISANNYHGGFCGNANAETTTFSNCLFNPTESGFYWAENFIFNTTGDLPNNYYNTCYYTLGHNQEESDQGKMVFVNTVPEGNIGHKLTTFHEKVVYEPVTVTISGVKKRYVYDNGNEVLNISQVGVEFNEQDAIENEWCSKVITDSVQPVPNVVESVRNKGKYTLTITAPKPGVASDYLGSVTQIIRVVKANSIGWAGLQAKLSGSDATITLTEDIEAGTNDACLVIEGDRTVTINLNGFKIDRGFYNGGDKWDAAVVGGQVLKIASGNNTVIINGPGTIMGGCNKASSNTEHAENSDAGGIFNMGNLTLNEVTIEGNYCEKYSAGVSRTARGGGIYSGIGSKLIINDCTITHNEAKGGGGGLYAEKAAVFEMKDTNVQSNKSQDKGGGIRLDANGTKHLEGNTQVANALISGCTIENNTVELHTTESASNGGGIHHDDGTLDLVNCTIQRNNSSKYGGGIYIMKGTINATNCNISYNRSYDSSNKFEGYGGGICLLGGSVKLNGGTITGNSSYKEDGGGVFVAAGKTLTIEGNLSITENWTYDDASLNTRHITNVYLVGTSDKIRISGSIEGSNIGVSKNGGAGQFTTNLDGKGTIANFSSDNTNYQILPITVDNKQEAKIGTPATWDDPTPDPETKKITITEPTYINNTVTESYEYTIVFTGDGCLIIGPKGVLTAKIENNDPLKLIIEDGGQVITNTTVAARVKKDVKEFSNYSGYWYLISSPVSNPVVSTATNIVVLDPDFSNGRPGYDLYRFNEAATATNDQGLLLQWENYRAADTAGEVITPVHPDFTTLANGRGYLYRSCQDYTVTIDGNLNVGTVNSYTLTNIGTNELKGFNIIGNPYPHSIKKGAGQAIPNDYLEDKYYVLNPTGCVWELKTDATEIPPFTGILVQAKSEVTALGQTLTISDVAISSSKGGYGKANNSNIWFTVANDTYEDKACVELREGHGLNKIAHINEEAPMIYIHHNDEAFASADLRPDTKAFDLNFEAKTMGRYTLRVKPQGEYSYLHLYDKLTGNDVDLLVENEYSFIGTPNDQADRFVVRLGIAGNDEMEIFAYQSGDDLVIDGEGELQVFDMMGRLVMKQHISGVQTIRKPSQTGVYILRLNEVSQKIVVK